MLLGNEVGLAPGHIVLDGDPDPHPRKRHSSPSPHFLAHVYCGQRSPISATAELLFQLFAHITAESPFTLHFDALSRKLRFWTQSNAAVVEMGDRWPQ